MIEHNGFGSHLGAFLAAGGLIAGIGLFVLLGAEISTGHTQAFDREVLLAMRRPDTLAPRGSLAFQQTARDISALGSTTVLILLTLAVAGFLAIDGHKRGALFVCGCVATGLILSTALKDLFGRPRPDLVPTAIFADGASFPSGHSMLSAVTYLSLGALVARFYRQKAIKVYIFSLAALLVALIGVSRVYLGVHWPTDVLAGWIAGAVWALLCWLAALAIGPRKFGGSGFPGCGPPGYGSVPDVPGSPQPRL